mmetsp:Transcript_5925/g.36733  ORF Transcript_5925/g.36733 Transcript_5925/m.36733 type:complete len:305 (-) Transcript_5925:16-930(-)
MGVLHHAGGPVRPRRGQGRRWLRQGALRQAPRRGRAPERGWQHRRLPGRRGLQAHREGQRGDGRVDDHLGEPQRRGGPHQPQHLEASEGPRHHPRRHQARCGRRRLQADFHDRPHQGGLPAHAARGRPLERERLRVGDVHRWACHASTLLQAARRVHHQHVRRGGRLHEQRLPLRGPRHRRGQDHFRRRLGERRRERPLARGLPARLQHRRRGRPRRRGHRRQPHGVRHHNEERLRGSRSERHADIGHRAVRGRRLLAPPANGGGHRGLSRTLPSRLEWTERYQRLLRTSIGWMCGMLQQFVSK